MRYEWSKDEERYLIQNYPNHTAKEIADKLGRSERSVYFRASLLNLKKDMEFIRAIGRKAAKHPLSVATRFKKGNISPNKGKKLSAETYEKVKRTMFHKGCRPHNTAPVGTHRITKDGYEEVKVAEQGRWKGLHRIVWEEAFGEIPKGSAVIFKNGDKRDVRLENLMLVSRRELLRLNDEKTREWRQTTIIINQAKKELEKWKERQKE